MDQFGKLLRSKLEERRGLLVPGAADALSARVIASLGFEAIYITGAGVTNALLGMPDLGFISLPELAQQTSAIREAVELPIIVDADTGFGNALNVRHTVQVLERAGANAIQIEDQVFPKRCGHFSGKQVIAAEEMMAKIRAAADARRSQDFLIIARTDARAEHGFQAAIDRAAKWIEAGADVTFVEAPESLEEVKRIPALLRVPQAHQHGSGRENADRGCRGARLHGLCRGAVRKCRFAGSHCGNAGRVVGIESARLSGREQRQNRELRGAATSGAKAALR